jgi:hypothetical protein
MILDLKKDLGPGADALNGYLSIPVPVRLNPRRVPTSKELAGQASIES